MSSLDLFSTNNYDFDITINEITEDDVKSPNPDCNILLKPHQLSLLYRCIKYENDSSLDLSIFKSLSDSPFIKSGNTFKTNFGVISDRVGSGKSYVILSIIKSNNIMDRKTTIVKSSGMNNVSFYFNDDKRVIKTNVIVIPHNLSSQWEQYIINFKTIQKYKIINRQKTLVAFEEDEDNIEDYDLIVVTATNFNKLCSIFNKREVRFQRIFFDEVDALNINGCNHIYSNFIWFVTASYGNILYPRGFTKYDQILHKHVWCAEGIRNSGFVKNLFLDLYTHLSRNLTKVLILKNSDDYIEKSLQLPALKMNIIKCKTPYTINILTGVVDKNVIDSLNAGDTRTAISFINSNNKGTEDNIITILIDKFTKQLVNNELQYNMLGEMLYDDENDRAQDKLILQRRIDDTKNKIKQITDRIESSNLCNICYDTIDNKTITKCCQNSFCFSCIHIWLSKGRAMCPLCKDKLTDKNLFVVCDTIDENEVVVPEVPQDQLNERFDKLKNLKILLTTKKNTNAKILIFAAYDNVFSRITPILNELDLHYEYIKGNGDQVKMIVKRYKSDKVDVLLINTRNYGTGLNLENTTDVIMFHKFDTQLESQVIGRAHRYGRTESLNVYYLLHETELSETT